MVVLVSEGTARGMIGVRLATTGVAAVDTGVATPQAAKGTIVRMISRETTNRRCCKYSEKPFSLKLAVKYLYTAHNVRRLYPQQSDCEIT